MKSGSERIVMTIDINSVFRRNDEFNPKINYPDHVVGNGLPYQ